EKIQEHGCENLVLENFGKLELENIDLATPELWASMITGERPEVHGIDTMLTFRGEKVRKLDNAILRVLKTFGISALHLRRALHYYLFDSSIFVPDKEFLEVDSIFEKVADSVALDIPGYSEYPYIAGKSFVAKSHRKRPPISKDRVLRDMEAEHEYRKQQLFDNIGSHTLVMQHLHYPDWFQHLYPGNDEKDAELYQKMDELAGEILERVNDDTLVVFCSDHGIDEAGGHRDQAFYSTNAEIGDDVKITDLLFRCLEKVDYEKGEKAVEEIEI
ncbi:MAG: alkaline phosphatase family protein, partial [Candidatus Nanohaloarchaea archaeon]